MAVMSVTRPQRRALALNLRLDLGQRRPDRHTPAAAGEIAED